MGKDGAVQKRARRHADAGGGGGEAEPPAKRRRAEMGFIPTVQDFSLLPRRVAATVAPPAWPAHGGGGTEAAARVGAEHGDDMDEGTRVATPVQQRQRAASGAEEARLRALHKLALRGCVQVQSQDGRRRYDNVFECAACGAPTPVHGSHFVPCRVCNGRFLRRTGGRPAPSRADAGRVHVTSQGVRHRQLFEWPTKETLYMWQCYH